MIKASGVLLWREQEVLNVQVLLVHRSLYDDWTFPKGKAEPGEGYLQTAFRECLEETGITPILGQYLGEVEYRAEGEKKRVFYWMAKAGNDSTSFVANDEVDKIEWMTVKEARHFLSYEEDREILRKFVKAERHSSSMIFLRHAKAVKRDEWFGEDADRPLSHLGQMQAAKLGANLKVYGVSEIHSSDAIRCLDTARTLGESIHTQVKSSNLLSEDYYERDDNAASEYVDFLLNFNRNIVVCGHNPIFNDMLLAFENGKEFSKNLEKLSPADAWVIHHIGRRIMAVDSIPAPTVEKTN